MLRVKCLAVSLQVIYVLFFFIFSLAARVLMGGEFFCFSYHNIKFWMCFVINKRDMNTPQTLICRQTGMCCTFCSMPFFICGGCSQTLQHNWLGMELRTLSTNSATQERMFFSNRLILIRVVVTKIKRCVHVHKNKYINLLCGSERRTENSDHFH